MTRESVVRDESCLLEAWHALADVDVDPSPFVLEVVLGDDFIWNDGKRELHIFEPYHGSKVIKKFKV